MGSESRARSLAKMASYRIVIIFLLIAIAWYYTGNAGQTTTITVLFNMVGSIVYYVYERLWGAITWGTLDAPRRQGVGFQIPDISLGSMVTAKVGKDALFDE